MTATGLHTRRHRHVRVMVCSVAAALLTFLSWGCAARRINPELDVARAELVRARSDPTVRQSAAVALHEAEQALRRAEDIQKGGGDDSEVDHLVYVAQRQVEIARTMAAYEQTRAEIQAARRRVAIERQNSKPTVYSSRTLASPVEILVSSAPDGAVDGRLFNRSSKAIEEVKLVIHHEWLWDNETHPGEVSPGRTEYYQVPGRIPPGGSVRFGYEPSAPLPDRGDGRFETSVEVVGFEEIAG